MPDRSYSGLVYNTLTRYKENIGKYIFVIAYLNALTNGRFDYTAFLKDVEFLQNIFPNPEELPEEFRDPKKLISIALSNSIQFLLLTYSSPRDIHGSSPREINAPAYQDHKGRPLISIDVHLMKKLLELGCCTYNKRIRVGGYINRDDVEFNLIEIERKLPEILERIVSEALALDEVQKEERKNAYKEIKFKLGKEGYADLLERLTEERVELQKQPPPPTISSNRTQIQL
jgi:hypothetical protein